MGEIGRSRELRPRVRPAARTGFYLHVTQLHAQIQLAVSLSPVDVRRQHLILHGHTAQGAGRWIAALRCFGEWATGACRTQATNPRALERGHPATSRHPTLAGCACAVKIVGGVAVSAWPLLGSEGGGAEQRYDWPVTPEREAAAWAIANQQVRAWRFSLFSRAML